MSFDVQAVKLAKFNIGDQIVHHNHGYRGIIVDIDPLFQASGRYNPLAYRYPFTTRHPWYRILVDNSSQITYVEEPLLVKDHLPKKITNPQLGFYLIERNGRYQRNKLPN